MSPVFITGTVYKTITTEFERTLTMNVHQKSTLTLSGRLAIYSIGLIILALGITLNTKTGLGVSPIISIPYNISQIWHLNLGTMTFIFYTILVMIQILLLRKDFKIYQLLQIVMSLVTSFFIDIFDRMIPAVTPAFGRILILFLAIILTGIGAALTVGMEIIPNPADGLANVIGQKLNKGFGLGKNIFDFSCLVLSVIISLCFAGHITGIGIGTILSMIFTGRVVAFSGQWIRKFSHFK